MFKLFNKKEKQLVQEQTPLDPFWIKIADSLQKDRWIISETVRNDYNTTRTVTRLDGVKLEFFHSHQHGALESWFAFRVYIDDLMFEIQNDTREYRLIGSILNPKFEQLDYYKRQEKEFELQEKKHKREEELKLAMIQCEKHKQETLKKYGF